jgi:hypothetical protein
MIEKPVNPIASLQANDVVAIVDRKGGVGKYATVTKRIAAGLMVEGNVYNEEGRAEVGDTTIRPATDVEVLIYDLKKVPGKAWERIPTAELRKLLIRLTEKK